MKIPVIGNGDIDSPQRAAEAFDRYGVDGVMIGRATYGRPWIFREIRHYLDTGELLPQPSVCERVEIAKRHLAKSVEVKGERVGVLEMRRHLSNYFKGLPDFKPKSTPRSIISRRSGAERTFRVRFRRRCRTEYSACLPLLRSGHCSG